jgi:hypothetical protein
MTDVCVNTDHFAVSDDGTLSLQPWMQWRHVESVAAKSKSVNYSPAGKGQSSFLTGVPMLGSVLGSGFGGLGLGGIGGTSEGNKNELLHSLTGSYLNDTPVDQYCYGMVTRGGSRVTLQARSRAYLALWTGQSVGGTPVLTLASAMGCGGDIGRAGTLSVGTGYCIVEQRQQSLTIPLAPEKTGWQRLTPGQTLNAKVELRFVSDVWENTLIDGGSGESESSFLSGDTRLDLFAVPALD